MFLSSMFLGTLLKGEEAKGIELRVTHRNMLITHIVIV
jgi:hypothetical protein